VKLLVCAGAAAALLTACNPSVQVSSSPSPSPNPSASGIALKITGHGTGARPVRFVAQEQKTNRVQYDLLATSFESIGAAGSARVAFASARVTFHGKDGSTLFARAPQAIVDQTTNTIEMLGGVHAANEAGTTLTCDELRYDRRTEMVDGSGHVTIVSKDGFRATGDRIESDISLTHTRMQ